MPVIETTARDTEHFRKYAALLGKSPQSHMLRDGVEHFLRHEEVPKKYAADNSLNNIGLGTWDAMASVLTNVMPQGLALSEKVCLLKHVAIYAVDWPKQVRRW